MIRLPFLQPVSAITARVPDWLLPVQNPAAGEAVGHALQHLPRLPNLPAMWDDAAHGFGENTQAPSGPAPDLAAPLDQLLAAWRAAPDRAAFAEAVRAGLAHTPARLEVFTQRLQAMQDFQQRLAALLAVLTAGTGPGAPFLARAARDFTRRCLKKLYQGRFDMARHWTPEWLLRRAAELAGDTAAGGAETFARLRREPAAGLGTMLGAWPAEMVVASMFHAAYDFLAVGEPRYHAIRRGALSDFAGDAASLARREGLLQNAVDFLQSARDIRAMLIRDYPQFRAFIDVQVLQRLRDAAPYVQRGVPFLLLYRSDAALRRQLADMARAAARALVNQPASPRSTLAPPAAADVQAVRDFFRTASNRELIGADVTQPSGSGWKATDIRQGKFRFRSDLKDEGLHRLLSFALPGVAESRSRIVGAAPLAWLDYGLTREGRRSGYNPIRSYYFEDPPRSDRFTRVELRDTPQKGGGDRWWVYYRLEGRREWIRSPVERTAASIREAGDHLTRLATQAMNAPEPAGAAAGSFMLTA